MSHFTLAKVVYRRVPSAGTENVPERSNKVSVSTLMHFPTLSPLLIILCFYIYIFFSFSVLFHFIFNAVVPSRGQTHHLAPFLKPMKSKLCLWITIHQNTFPHRAPHGALITEESRFYLWRSHFWPCFWSAF